jgi:hypothetical protein
MVCLCSLFICYDMDPICYISMIFVQSYTLSNFEADLAADAALLPYVTSLTLIPLQQLVTFFLL